MEVETPAPRNGDEKRKTENGDTTTGHRPVRDGYGIATDQPFWCLIVVHDRFRFLKLFILRSMFGNRFNRTRCYFFDFCKFENYRLVNIGVLLYCMRKNWYWN